MPTKFSVFIYLCLFSNVVLAQPYNSLYEREWFQKRIDWKKKYEILAPLTADFAAIRVGNKQGIVNQLGEEVWPITDAGPYFYQTHNILHYPDRTFVSVDEKTGTIVQHRSSDHYYLMPNRRVLRVEGLSGVCDDSGKIILPIQFTHLQKGHDKFIVADSTIQKKYGLLTKYGEWLIKPRYKSISETRFGLFLVQNRANYYALFDSTGRQLIPFHFGHIVPLCDGTFWAKKPPFRCEGQDEYQHFDAQGKLIDHAVYSRFLTDRGYNVLRVKQGDKYLYWDSCGHEITPDASWIFEERTGAFCGQGPSKPVNALVYQKNGQYGLIMQKNHAIITANYLTFFSSANNEIAAVRPSGETDWLNAEGLLLKTLPYQITAGTRPQKSRYFFAKNKAGKTGVIDENHNIIIDFNCTSLSYVGSGCFQCTDSLKGVHLYNPFGQPILLPDGYRFESLNGNYILCKKDSFKVITDLSGQVLTRTTRPGMRQTDAYTFSFYHNEKFAKMDPYGKETYPGDYDYLPLPDEKGRIFASKKGLQGVADTAGRILVPFEFPEKREVEGHILYLKNRQGYLFDKSSNQLTLLDWEWHGYMYKFIKARKNGCWGLLNDELKELIPFEYDSIGNTAYNFIVLQKDGKERCTKVVNGKLFPFFADKVIRDFYDNGLVFEVKGKQGMITNSGDTISARYDKIAVDYHCQKPMAYLNQGVCTVPDSIGKIKYRFSADSLRTFYIPDLLQYWYKGKAYLMNVRNGAKRQIELYLKEGEGLEMHFDIGNPEVIIPKSTFNLYPVNVKGQRWYILLDEDLKDRIPYKIQRGENDHILTPDGKTYFVVTNNMRKGLWSLEESKLVLPLEYQYIAQIKQLESFESRAKRPTLACGGSYSRATYRTYSLVVKKSNFYGIYDLISRKMILPEEYTEVPLLADQHGILELNKADDMGYFSLNSHKTLMMAKGLIAQYSEQYKDTTYSFSVSDSLYGIFSKSMDIILPAKFEQIKTIRKVYTAKLNGLWGFYDSTGKLIKPHIYTNIAFREFENPESKEWQDALIVVDQNNKSWLWNKQLVQLTQKPYSAISLDSKYGLLDCADYHFSPENVLTEYHGLLDSTGREVLPLLYEEIEICDRCIVALDHSGLYHLFDLNGKKVLSLDYDAVECDEHKLLWVKKHGKWGLINDKGEVLAECRFSKFNWFDGKTLQAKVTEGTQTFWIDLKGRCVKDCP